MPGEAAREMGLIGEAAIEGDLESSLGYLRAGVCRALDGAW